LDYVVKSRYLEKLDRPLFLVGFKVRVATDMQHTVCIHDATCSIPCADTMQLAAYRVHTRCNMQHTVCIHDATCSIPDKSATGRPFLAVGYTVG
jgi:hypothetical protein